MKNKLNKSLVCLTFVCISLLVGCKNTAAGFGQDMEHNGQEIRKAVNS